MKNITVLFFLTFFSTFINAQIVIKGVVKSQENESIQYCSIGIKDSKTGTITNKNGGYEIVIPNDYSQSVVIFYAEGFIEKSIEISELQKNPNVYLEEKIIELNEVNVSVNKLKEKIIGVKSRPMLTFSKMFDKSVPTIEQGNIFDIYKKTKINAYSFHIIPSSKYEQITLKLNIYDVKNNLPNKSLLSESVIYKTSSTEWQNIDLTKYKLTFNNIDKIAITLQLVDYVPLKESDFIFGISAKKSLSKNLLFRYQSQSQWENSSGIFLSNINVEYDKQGNSEVQGDDLDSAFSEKERKMMSFYSGREAGLKTVYGKSSEGKFLNLSDAKIYYEEYGKGEPLILLEGNNSLISDFYNLIPFLSKYYRVIAIDTRAQGKSLDFSKDDYGYDKFADDLLEIVKQLKLEEINIVGWSDGGITGLIFNYKYTDYIEKLVTIGANTNPKGVKEETLKMIKETFDNSNDSKERRRLNLMINYPHITNEDLSKIENPVLVIAGDDDEIKEEHTREIAEMIKKSKLEIISNSSHNIPFDQPEILNEIILDFLKNKEK